MSAAVPEARAILKLYKDLLRYSSSLKYTDNNFFISRIRKEFANHKTLTDSAKIQFQYQPFAIAPVRSVASRNHVLLASISASHAESLQQLLSPAVSPRKIDYRCKHQIDKSRIPVLDEAELEEQFIKGSGPGGSKVNKMVNCCYLKHKPTGISVKCHFYRTLEENRKLARVILVGKLDNHINGERSIEAQKECILAKKSDRARQKAVKLAEQKRKYQELLRSENQASDEVPAAAVASLTNPP